MQHVYAAIYLIDDRALLHLNDRHALHFRARRAFRCFYVFLTDHHYGDHDRHPLWSDVHSRCVCACSPQRLTM